MGKDYQWYSKKGGKRKHYPGSEWAGIVIAKLLNESKTTTQKTVGDEGTELMSDHWSREYSCGKKKRKPS